MKTCLSDVMDDERSFDLSWDDAQVRNRRKRKICGWVPSQPRLSSKVAVDTVCRWVMHGVLCVLMQSLTLPFQQLKVIARNQAWKFNSPLDRPMSSAAELNFSDKPLTYAICTANYTCSASVVYVSQSIAAPRSMNLSHSGFLLKTGSNPRDGIYITQILCYAFTVCSVFSSLLFCLLLTTHFVVLPTSVLLHEFIFVHHRVSVCVHARSWLLFAWRC